MVRILSFGGGVNSVALLVLAARGVVDVDEVVFCDTGCEMPETYEYIRRVVRPFCHVNDIFFIETCRGRELLPAFCERMRVVPNRRFRWCTDKFKLRPLRRYAVDAYPDEFVEWVLGYAADERKRADRCVTEGSVYPLIDLGLDREGCKRVILEAGLPVPVKSGCWLCPFKSSAGWADLFKRHRDLFDAAERLEKNTPRYPEMVLAYPETGSLECFRRKFEANKLSSDVVKVTVQRELFCSVCEVVDVSDFSVDFGGFDVSLLKPLRGEVS